MGNSNAVRYLEAKLAAIDQKIASIKAAQASLSECRTKVKKTYNEADSDHVKGNQYDEYYADNQEMIQNMSDLLKTKKETIETALSDNLAALTKLREGVKWDLAIARLLDSLTS